VVKLDNDKLLMVDVDSTLFMYDWPESMNDKVIYINNNGWQQPVVLNTNHIELIKKFKWLGYGVVIWSLTGSAWAAKAAKICGLEEYVDLVMSKPLFYCDDLKAEDILGKRIYKELK